VAGRRGWRRPGWSTDAQQIISRVFVYGTLREGQAARSMIENHVQGARPATARGRLFAFPEGYPGLVEGGQSIVIGEVLELADLTAGFALLDAYEGDDFCRVLLSATIDDGSETYAWAYVLSDQTIPEDAVLIDTGDWVRFLAEN
jgi:gamma-glutamylcyclotransferase (GGCT)/AIG2-like uncharacterized protein YtfP